MKNLKFVVAYDGTNYHGFQRQSNAITVQEILEKGIESLLKKKIKLIAASRTDAGVHAQGQVFNFITESSIPAERFPRALNTRLPDDVVILECEEVDMAFHARYSTSYKTYKYQIYNAEFLSPFFCNHAYHIYHKLDLNKMREGAKYLIGKHDFSSFRSAGCNAKTPIRTLFNIDIDKMENLITITITGSGFLYNMVRIIIGTLVRVGISKIEPMDVLNILLAKDRQKAGITAPAKGLRLERLYYEI